MSARRLGRPNPLHDFASQGEWGDVLEKQVREQQHAQAARDALKNESSWGDQANQDLSIAAAEVGTVSFGEQKQIVNVGPFPARGWTVSLGLDWRNKNEGVVGDEVIGIFQLVYGVGRARLRRLETISILQSASSSLATITLETIPAATIYVDAAAIAIVVAGAARTYRLTLSVLTAPVVR